MDNLDNLDFEDNLSAEQSTAMIEITNLTKRYGKKVAVDNISFKVEKGEILGFLGPNGAGKTTTMNILTGYISLSDGSVKVDGLSILDKPLEARAHIGYLPENPPLYHDMTVNEYLNFVYELKKVKLERQGHLEEVMGLVKILDVKNRLIKNLSKGYKQRVGLAQALLGNPEVLILDEPTVGLDPNQIIEIRSVIKELGKNRTVILSTHILPEASAICDRVIIINNGQIIASDTPQNLSQKLVGGGKYLIRVAANVTDIKNALTSIEGIKNIEAQGVKEEGSVDLIIEAVPETDIQKAIFAALAAKQLPILMLKPIEMSLEEVFITLTKDGGIKLTDEEQPQPAEVVDEVTEEQDDATEIEEQEPQENKDSKEEDE